MTSSSTKLKVCGKLMQCFHCALCYIVLMLALTRPARLSSDLDPDHTHTLRSVQFQDMDYGANGRGIRATEEMDRPL